MFSKRKKESEAIEDKDDLFRGLPPVWYVEKENRVSKGAFRDPEASVDWAKYSTPQETLDRFSRFCAVAALQAKVPRQHNLEVKHAPSLRNKSHSLIIGKKSLTVSRALANSCRLPLKLM